MKAILFLLLFSYFPEAHVSTHINSISLDKMIGLCDSILLVEEHSEKSLKKTHLGKSYTLSEKTFRVLKVFKHHDGAKPETITATSEREKSDAELSIEYEVTKRNKFPIYDSPDREFRADPKDKKKILFLKYDSASKTYGT